MDTGWLDEFVEQMRFMAAPVQARSMTDDLAKKGLRPHPYIKREIKLCFRTSEKETNDAYHAVALLDGVFGVHAHDHALFGGTSKAEKRDLQANVDMANLMGSVVKAAVKGESGEDLQEQFEQTQQSVADAQTEGLSVYSRRADEAESSIAG